MKESMPILEVPMTKEQFAQLAKELSEKGEGFAFHGLDEEAHAKLKATDEEYPGFTTPIDELITRFEAQGIKVVLGDDSTSGNVFLLPKDSSDVEMDSVMPRHLKVVDGMDPQLKKLVVNSKTLFTKK